jgi:hypothetical protein
VKNHAMRGVAVSRELTWRGKPRRGGSTRVMLFCECGDCTATRLHVTFDVPGLIGLDDAVRLLGLGGRGETR